jgi:hypothetical protein
MVVIREMEDKGVRGREVRPSKNVEGFVVFTFFSPKKT